MGDIPGKGCGACNLCCKILVIDHFEKDAGILCSNCVLGVGCKIYAKRPEVCQDFECDWKMERSIGANLRPDKVGTILMDDDESGEYQAVVDPSTPFAWRNPQMFKFLVMKAKEGRTVIAKSGLKSWRIYPSGEIGVWAG
ncbi:MAG: hypothetical protein BGP04_10645 [Rhizobiales bacterium 62-17]|nr:hypothetical protein [Hyphomicrobiales bacterium]OJY05788.1 MAG: hypothetical protein BGP04_10645 [Rhizobiales bacterium 62-17]